MLIIIIIISIMITFNNYCNGASGLRKLNLGNFLHYKKKVYVTQIKLLVMSPVLSGKNVAKTSILANCVNM